MKSDVYPVGRIPTLFRKHRAGLSGIRPDDAVASNIERIIEVSGEVGGAIDEVVAGHDYQAGSTAIGHLFRASGTRLVPTPARKLRKTDDKYSLITKCFGGGQSASCLLERP